MLNSRKILVSGRVQGVCYRASTQRMARQLGLTGWVRNLPTGDVEALVCGELEDIDAMQRWMGKGPEEARIDSLQGFEVQFESCTDFLIRR